MENYEFWTLVSMLAAGFGWLIYNVTHLKEKSAIQETKLDDVISNIGEMKSDIKSIDKRLTILETRFEERLPYMDYRKTGTEDNQ